MPQSRHSTLRETRDLEIFFKENYAKAYALALSIIHDEEASRDVVADAFETLIRRKDALPGTDRRSYLLMVVHNKCADHFRKLSVRDRYADWVIRSAEHTVADDWREHEERVEQVRAAMSQLTPRTRQILSSHYLERKKYREVAAELDISESAVKKHIVQALSFFRTKFVKE